MLVLSRARGSAICIGNNVTVTVLGIHKGQIRLGVEAPSGISVWRGEIAVAAQVEHISRPYTSKTKQASRVT